MRKSFKKLFILILSIITIASFTLGLGLTTVADTTDVNLAFSNTADFTTGTTTIENEEVSTFGCNGWGGMVKVLAFDKPYDVSAIAANKNGAFSFDLYIGDQTTLENLQGASHWNIDICSDAEYNDTNKYSFNLMSGSDVFGNCKIGWNRVVLFLSSANEKNSINWATVQTMRFNTNTPAGNVLQFANFKFTVTSVQEPDRFVLKVGENTLETVSLAANAKAKFGDVNCTYTDFISGTDWSGQQKQFDYYNGTAVEKKNCFFFKQIGSYHALISYNTPVDASAYATGATLNNPNAALSFFIFFKTEECLKTYQNEITNLNIDISSGADKGDGTYAFSDANKWSINVASALENCRVGWNKVIVPLNLAGEKYVGMDWSNIRFIRYSMLGLTGTADVRAGMGGDFALCTSEYTQITVLDEEQKLFPYLDKSKTSVVQFNNVDLVRDGEVIQTYIKPNKGGWVTILDYSDAPIDLSHFTAENKQFAQDVKQVLDTDMKDEYAAVSLYLYFSDKYNLEAYQACSGFNIDVSSGADNGDGTYSYSDNYKYSFNFAKLFEKCSVGWNRLILPLTTHDVEAANAAMDWSNVRFIRFNGSQFPGGEHPVTGKGYRLGISDIGMCFSSSTEMMVEGWVPSDEEEVIKNEKVYCDGGTGLHILGFDTTMGDGQVINTAGYYKEGKGALRFNGQGTAGTAKKFDKPFDLSMYDKLSFWLYTDNAANFLSMGDGQIELTSAGAKDDNNEYSWSLKELNLKDGWNWVVLDIASAKKGEPDITKIDYFNIYFVSVPAIGETIIDDLHAHTSQGVVLESFDNGFLGQVQTVDGKVDKATNMSGEGWVARKKFTNVSFNIADSDTLALWVYCENADTASTIAGTEIEISSSGSADNQELAFYLPSNLKTGWNYVTWKLSDGVKSGEIDLTAVDFIGIVKVGIPAVTCYFDDLRAYDSRFTNVEIIEPIEKEVIINADKPVSGVFESMSIDDVEYKEGFASLSINTNEGTTTLSANLAPIVSGLSLNGENELGYAFWLYVEDLSKLTSLSVELGSYANQAFELEWAIDLTELENGWNWITLKASDAERPNGVIDLNNIIRTGLVIEGGATTIKLDCFVIVDSTKDGAFTPIEDKVELNPIDSVVISDCDTKWAYIDHYTEIDGVNKQQGYSSVKIPTDGLMATQNVNGEKTDLLYNPYKSNNQLGIAYWIYIEDASIITWTKIILMNEIAGTNTASWTVSSGFTNGWNYVVLGCDAAEFTGVFNPDAITHVQFGASATTLTNVLIDRVSVINYAKEENRTAPEYSGITREPVEDKVIIDCNYTGGTLFSGNSVNKDDFRYGSGCVETSGYGYQLAATEVSIGKTDLTKDTFVLGLWIWIEDITLYTGSDSIETQIEIGSSSQDIYELNWADWWKDLENGWNWVVLYGKDATVSGAEPDYDNLSRFRIYVNRIEISTLRIDRITLSHIGDEDFATAPNWEEEVTDQDATFVGSNNAMAENSTFIEVDFDGLKENFVVLEQQAGCGSNIAVQSPVWLLFAVAVLVFFKKKSKIKE